MNNAIPSFIQISSLKLSSLEKYKLLPEEVFFDLMRGMSSSSKAKLLECKIQNSGLVVVS